MKSTQTSRCGFAALVKPAIGAEGERGKERVRERAIRIYKLPLVISLGGNYPHEYIRMENCAPMFEKIEAEEDVSHACKPLVIKYNANDAFIK